MKKVFDATVLMLYISILCGFTIILLSSFIWLINKMDIVNISTNFGQCLLVIVIIIIGIIIGFILANIIFNQGVELEKQRNKCKYKSDK